MTDKEFKRLSRAELIDVIYQLQLQVDTLSEQNQKLKMALSDKRIRINSVGNIAEAALEINNCFVSAQKAAEQYLDEIKALREEAEADCARLLEEARAEAEAIRSAAKMDPGDYEAELADIVQEYGQQPEEQPGEQPQKQDE